MHRFFDFHLHFGLESGLSDIGLNPNLASTPGSFPVPIDVDLIG